MEVTEKHIYVDPKDLPSLSELNVKVRDLEEKCSWYERYGVDWVQFVGAICAVPVALLILRNDTIACQALGILLMCGYHTSLTARAGHLASHGALAESPKINYFLHVLFGEFVGSFSTKCGHDIHIKFHHPHTNIIGLGDSSTWKAPYLPRYVYMFIAPFSLPLLIPIAAIHQLVAERSWKDLATFFIIAPAGLALHAGLLMYISGFTLLGALGIIYLYRGTLSVPYIHINIFQHIGLPMYSPEDRPARIYQMSTGCLNISPNHLFNFAFGHSLVSCHVEHHLFPRLSDNMCLKIKPLVSRFLTESGLPYQQEDYFSRLRMFIDNFDSLMVDAPAITHFMGLQ